MFLMLLFPLSMDFIQGTFIISILNFRTYILFLTDILSFLSWFFLLS